MGMAMMTLIEMGWTDLSATVSIIGLWGFLRLCLPPWSETRQAIFPSSRGKGSMGETFLALDHFVYQVVECSDDNGVCVDIDSDTVLSDDDAIQRRECGLHDSSCVVCSPHTSPSFSSASSSSSSSSSSSASSSQTPPINLLLSDKMRDLHKEAVLGSPACAICLCSWQSGDQLSMGRQCKHVFHQDCLRRWLPKSTTCPYCRSDLEVPCGPSSVQKTGNVAGTLQPPSPLDWVFETVFHG